MGRDRNKFKVVWENLHKRKELVPLSQDLRGLHNRRSSVTEVLRLSCVLTERQNHFQGPHGLRSPATVTIFPEHSSYSRF